MPKISADEQRRSRRIEYAELITLAVLQALLGFTSEAHWLRHARAEI